MIQHSGGNYARRKGGKKIHINSAEAFFARLKRGIIGTFHHVSRQHLYRYLADFDFRYNAPNVSDAERALLALKAVSGKRLVYRETVPQAGPSTIAGQLSGV